MSDINSTTSAPAAEEKPKKLTKAEQLAAREAELAAREAALAEKEREAAIAEKEAELAAREAAVDPQRDYEDVYLIEDGERYTGDVPVTVNGKCYLVQRGVHVKVPRAVAEILRHSEEQDNQTAMMIKRKEAEYEASSKATGAI